MRRLLVAAIATALGACAAAQTIARAADAAISRAEANKAKQEMVKSTTESQTRQLSGGGYHGAKPNSEASKLSNEEKQQVMQGVAKSAKDQYRPITPPDATDGKDASKAKPKPKMSDPDMQEAIRKNQHS
jgi:hypothetical protein